MSILTEYINTLKSSSRSLTEFDEGLFAALLDKENLRAKHLVFLILYEDKMIVNKDKVQVVWRDGNTMEVLK